MKSTSIKAQFPLDFQWKTQGPFLFFAYHKDQYPAGNGHLGVEPKHLSSRNSGSDFEIRNGFRMYHGESIPGFPVHPHRGFETITIVTEGFADHADSLGAAGRYGQGDVQWMTAGAGVQHSEMFPLLHTSKENHLELFQIWLNLPKKNKMVSPHFKMLWSEKIPKVTENQNRVAIQVIAGKYKETSSLSSPPDSWASDPQSQLLILMVEIKKGGQWQIPSEINEIPRSLYFYSGHEMQVDTVKVSKNSGLELDSTQSPTIIATDSDIKILILQAQPIQEPVVQHGPFVMNSKTEIMQAFEDYQQTHFGGWPWPRPDMVHGDQPERFAKHPDGRIEKPQD
jgi:redox-sensitive bicupin YhaK (pirin superfamily)